MTYEVRIYRVDTGAPVHHLTRAYASAPEAAAAAIAINCKAFVPFYATARVNT
jgi:hypothetical protein